MLHSTKDLENYAIGATDGHVGYVKDFLFDDGLWVVRYIVVYTGSWLSGRRVLISPIALRRPHPAERVLAAAVTQAQVRDSPDIDPRRPVTRHCELEYAGHYGYPDYWGGTSLWAGGMYPDALMPDDHGHRRREDGAREEEEEACRAAQRERPRGDAPRLRSCRALEGYLVRADDGDIGHVRGFLLDEDSWAVRALVVATSHWWSGHEVLIAPQRITAVDWDDRSLSVYLTREFVKVAPRYDAGMKKDPGHPLGAHLAEQPGTRPDAAIHPRPAASDDSS